MRGFAVIDCETTGLNKTGSDRIAEIAIAIYDKHFNLTGQYETVINPEQDLGMTSLHGINGLMASNAPKFKQVMDAIAYLLNDRVIIGHNVEFDLKFIAHEFSKENIGINWKNSYIDTLKMAKDANLVTENNQLATLCSHFEIPLLNAHSAMADVLATAQLCKALLKLNGNSIPLTDPLQFPEYDFSKNVSNWTSRQHINEKLELFHNLSSLVRRLPHNAVKELSPQDKHIFLNTLHLCLINNSFTYREGEVMKEVILSLSLCQKQVVELQEEYLGTLLSQEIIQGRTDSNYDLIRTALYFTGVEERRVLEMREELLNEPYILAVRLETFRSLFSLQPGDGLVITGEEFSKSKSHLKSSLQTAGFRVLPSTTKSGTKALIANDPYSLSNKASTARRFGIPIITEATVERLIGNL